MNPKIGFPKAWQVILFVVLILAGGFFILGSSKTDKTIAEAVAKSNSNMPKMLNGNTRLDFIDSYKNTVTYNHTILDVRDTEIALIDFEGKVRGDLLSVACSDPKMQIFRDSKTTLVYKYKNQHGKLMKEFSIKLPKDCP